MGACLNSALRRNLSLTFRLVTPVVDLWSWRSQEQDSYPDRYVVCINPRVGSSQVPSLGLSDPENPSPHKRHTIVLIPPSTPGVKVVRPLKVFGYDDAPEGHCEVLYDNVVLDEKECMVGGWGRGFEVRRVCVTRFRFSQSDSLVVADHPRSTGVNSSRVGLLGHYQTDHVPAM